MKQESDTDLVARARRGSKEAFGTLVERYQPMAMRVARDVISDADSARDIAQEAMLHAYLSLRHLKDDGRFTSWLHGIVLNLCRSHIRDRWRYRESFESIAGGVLFEAVTSQGAWCEPERAL